MSARRQWEGVPEMCVTPAAAARDRKSGRGSAEFDRTRGEPDNMARR